MPENEIVQIARLMIQALVDNPAAVRIEAHLGNSTTLLVAHVAQGQAGQLIGKHGRNIEAVRTLLSACAAKMHRRVHLDFSDEVL